MRILDLDGLFLRDDVAYNAETEVAIETESPQGLFRPRWDGTGWVEDMTAEQIQALKDSAVPVEPTLEEKVEKHDGKIVTIEEALDAIFGGV